MQKLTFEREVTSSDQLERSSSFMKTSKEPPNTSHFLPVILSKIHITYAHTFVQIYLDFSFIKLNFTSIKLKKTKEFSSRN